MRVSDEHIVHPEEPLQLKRTTVSAVEKLPFVQKPAWDCGGWRLIVQDRLEERRGEKIEKEEGRREMDKESEGQTWSS